MTSTTTTAAKPTTAAGLVRRLAAAAAVFLAAWSYFSLFRDYGFQFEDEGTLLLQLERASRGEYPYVDFHTGYTPGFFAMGSALLEAVGFHLSGLRAALALLHAAIAAGLYLVAAPLVGGWLGLASPLAYAAFHSVWAGDFAAFNVPYPAWFATAAWVTEALVATAWLRRGGLGLVLVAGAVAGAAFGFKPNAGAFTLAATTWIVAFGARDEGALDRWAARAASAAMLAGIWFAFGLVVFSVDAAVHLPPCIALAALAAGRGRASLATNRHPRALVALVALAAGFLLPTAVWTVPVLGRLGVDGFLRDVLLIGSGAAEVYWLPHPRPELYAVAVTGGLVGVAAVGRAIAAGLVAPAFPYALLAGGTMAAALAFRLLALAPEGQRMSVLLQLENAAFWIAPLANLAAAWLLARRLGAQMPARDATRRLAAVVPLAAAMYLQLFPRSDFSHVLMGVPLLFVAGLFLLRRMAAWWSAGAWPAWTRGRHAVGAYVAVLLFSVLAIRFGVNLEPLARVAVSDDVRREGVHTARATLWVENRAADDLAAVGRTADWLVSHARPHEDVLAFPAAAGLLYLAGMSSPLPHDYWVAGRPTHEEEEAMLGRLALAPPRFAVALNSMWNYFAPSATYFEAARRFACERYRLVARFGRFDVLARRDLDAFEGAAVETWRPGGSLVTSAIHDLSARRQAIRRWLDGLASSAITLPARLPSSRVEALLLLRGIRDAGDLRASAWLVAGWRSTDARIRSEALSAMERVLVALKADTHRWACDLAVADYAPWVAGLAIDARALGEDPDPRARAFAEALLAAGAPGS